MTQSRLFGVRIDPGVSIGHLITALPSLALVIWFLSGKVTTFDNTQTEMKTFKAEITAQVSALKIDMTAQNVALRADMIAQTTQLQVNTDKQFNMTRASIDNLPSMTERVGQLEKRVDKAERQLETVQSSGIETTANMNNLLRQLGAAQKIPR